MTKLIELALGLTDKLMGSLLDWPFLLFIVAAWVLTRYRDQIGSMLDRRGAVGAGVVISAVRREMQPVLTEVEGLAKAVSELKYEVERLQALHSENRLSRVLEPVKQRISGLEEAIARTQTETERIVRKDVSETLTKERSAVKAEIDNIRQVLDQYAARIKSLAAQEVVDRTNADVKAAQAELGAVTKTVHELQSYTETLAKKDATEDLKKEIQALAQGSQELRKSLVDLESLAKSLPAEVEGRFHGELTSLRGELSSAQETVAQLAAGLGRAATKDVTDKLQAEVDPLIAELATLKESIASFDASVAATAQELKDRVAGEVTPLAKEVATVTTAVNELNARIAAAASKETTDRLENAVAPLTAGLDELKASLTTLEGKIATGPKQLEDRFAEDVARVGTEVAALKEALEQVQTHASSPAAPAKGGKTDVLAAMKKALTTSGKAGRRIDALAKLAGVSEAQALEILASSAEFTLATNSKGQQTVRLAGK